jgi:sarcosine oxidase, subunit beta
MGPSLNNDVAIVGAGITGLSIAFHLAERGAEGVVVYEREGVGAGASGMQPGGVRQQWSTPLNCLLARASLAFYSRLDERLQPRVDIVFRPCGYVFVAHRRETLERLRRDVATQNAVGVPSRDVAPDELRELVPELDVTGIAGDGVAGHELRQGKGDERDPEAEEDEGGRAAEDEANERRGRHAEAGHVTR